MAKTKIPQTSLDAYHSLEPEKIRDIYQKIINSLAAINEGSMEDIARQCRLPREKIWKRLPELCRMDLIFRTNNKKPLRSGCQGYTYILTESGRLKITEKFIEGDTVSDFSKKLIPNKGNQQITNNNTLF